MPSSAFHLWQTAYAEKTLISSTPTTKHYYSGTIRYCILCAVALAAAGSFWVSRFLLWQMVYTKATKTNTVPTQHSTFACIMSQSERQSLKQSILHTIPSVSPTCSSYTQQRSLDPGWIDGAPSKNTKHLDQWHATRSMINKSVPFQGLNMRILIIIPTHVKVEVYRDIRTGRSQLCVLLRFITLIFKQSGRRIFEHRAAPSEPPSRDFTSQLHQWYATGVM